MTATLIACGNRKAHQNERGQQVHHTSVNEVRQCFATGGLTTVEDAQWADTVHAQQDEIELDLLFAEHEGADAAQAAAAPKPQPRVIKAPTQVLDGIYTVLTEGGHTTFRLRTQPEDADFAAGQQIIAYLSGSNNTSDYTGFGFVGGGILRVWKRHQSNTDLLDAAALLLADPASALEIGHCYKCHRPLTTPESLAVGYGPTCAGKG